MQDNTAGYIIISIMSLLFLTGCTAIICSIVFDNPVSYDYMPVRPKPKKVEDHLDDIIIDDNLFED
jgi:hypothetical protein